MPLQIFLNDLSSNQDALPHATAVSYLKVLVATTRSVRQIDPAVVLNSNTPIGLLSLGIGTTVAMIRNSGHCVEENLFLKTLQDRSPLVQSLVDLNGPDPGEFEYKIQMAAPIKAGVRAEALGLAHLLNGLALSLPSHAYWENAAISLDRTQLTLDGDLISTEVSARNACYPAQVRTHEDALRELNRPTFRDGSELWRIRSDLLPNLRFISRTRAQLEGILEGDPVLDSIWLKLQGLDQAISDWQRTGSAHPIFPFNTRPESRTRLPLVEFTDDNGVVRQFSQHVYFSPGEGRLHFDLEINPVRHAIVGHIGRKLGIG